MTGIFGLGDVASGAVLGGGFDILGGLMGGKPKTKGPQAQPLDPNLGLYGGQLAGLGQGALGDLSGFLGNGFSGAYGNMYNLMSEASNPARLGLENRLFQQGRLGSTGGAFQQQGFEQSVQDSAMANTQNYMKMLADMGSGMFGQLAPYTGITDPSIVDPFTGQLTEDEQLLQASQAAADQRETIRLSEAEAEQKAREFSQWGGGGVSEA